MADTRQTVTKNFFWRFLERCGAQLVAFIVSLILSRILEPRLYGTVALISAITTILSVFIDSGLGTALIQKKDSDTLDFSSVFYFNVAMCIFLYAVMFFLAPFIASFYGDESLRPLIRVQSLTLIISGVKNIQVAYVSKNLIFKKFFFATLAGTIIAAVIGITMALNGFGAWALVIQGLVNNFIDTVILWITVKWKPTKEFSFKRLKSLLNYGWKLLCSAFLDTVYNKLRQLVIGKKYTAQDLSFYDKGDHFPSFIVQNINTSIDSVLLPAMSKEQNDKERVKQMTRKSIKISTYIMMPMMMGLAVCAEPIIKLILTDKWLPCVFFLRCFCFTYAFYPIHSANLNAIKSLGRSDLFLILEIIKKAVGISILLITMWISVKAIALGLIVTSILSQIINSWPNKKLLNYSYLEQLKDIIPQILLSLFMGACVYALSYIPLNYVILLIIQILSGIIIYILGSKITKIDCYQYLLNTIKEIVQKKFKKNKISDEGETEKSSN